MKKLMKKVSSLTLAFVLFCSMGVTAFGAEASVEYEGDAQQFIFEPGSEESPTDLFTEFKGVMPGDQLSQTIRVKNDGAADVNVEIFMKADGAVEDEEFLNQMKLTVTAEDEKLFDAPADKTDGLTDWVSLGTFKKGADTELDVMLDVPVTMGNDFQNRIGKLNWTFKVAEYPIPEEEKEREKDTPATGDRNQMAVPVIIGLASMAGIAVLLKVKKRSEEK